MWNYLVFSFQHLSQMHTSYSQLHVLLCKLQLRPGLVITGSIYVTNYNGWVYRLKSMFETFCLKMHTNNVFKACL